VGRLETKADAHRQRAERDAATAADRLAFDDSMEGERLRRYESSCGRTLFRTIETFFKIRRAGDVGKSVPAAIAVESSTESVAPVDQGITQNELSWRRGGTQPHENGVRMLYTR